MKDYYKILEVEEKASDDEIKKSYRKLSKQFHPDLNPEGGEKFKEINEAYETLSDPNRRANYDNLKNNPYRGTNFENFFSQMFNNNFHQQPRRKSAPDKILRVEISPYESYLGIEKTINYFREFHCNTCNGTGGETQTCHSCGGSGAQIRTFGTGFMVQQVRQVCNDCGGKGFTLIHKCYYCDGRGTNTKASEIRVNIPLGADNGQFLKIPNLGDFRNGDYGDLLLQIEVNPKDGFEKINNDLIYNLILDLNSIQEPNWKIPHPTGELSISSPRTIDTSKPLRLRGKGYMGGDMYVKIVLKFDRSI